METFSNTTFLSHMQDTVYVFIQDTVKTTVQPIIIDSNQVSHWNLLIAFLIPLTIWMISIIYSVYKKWFSENEKTRFVLMNLILEFSHYTQMLSDTIAKYPVIQNNETESNKNFTYFLKKIHIEYQPRYFEMLKSQLLDLRLHSQNLFGVILCYSFIFSTLNQFKIFRNHKYFEDPQMNAFRINKIEKTYVDLWQEIALIESYINNYKDHIENYNKFNFWNFVINYNPRKPPTEVKDWLDTIYSRWKAQN